MTQTETAKCPIYEGNRDKPLSTEMRQLIKLEGLSSQYVNPGGYELIFNDGRRLQLHGMCNSCDEAKIREFLSPE